MAVWQRERQIIRDEQIDWYNCLLTFHQIGVKKKSFSSRNGKLTIAHVKYSAKTTPLFIQCPCAKFSRICPPPTQKPQQWMGECRSQQRLRTE